MSKDNNSQYNSSKPWAIFYKQAKNNLEEINANLLKYLENLDKENLQLKDVINELHNDCKEKENSLDESHKIITKLNEEYNKLMKEFKALEQYTNEIESENNHNKKVVEDFTKSHINFEKIQKQNENFKNEIEKLKKESKDTKMNIQSKVNENIKMEKGIKDKTNTLNEYKMKIENLESMIGEREKVISDYDVKFQELTIILNQKDEELKLLTKMSQEFGFENKTNIEELINQAVNTIKIFHNSLNNNLDPDLNRFVNNRVTISKNQKEDVSDSNFISKQEIENLIKENKVSFLVEDAITSNYKSLLTNYDLKSLPKEFIDNLCFKNELLKSELFSSLLRELNFTKFINDIIPKNENIINNNSSKEGGNKETNKPSNIIENIMNYIETMKSQNEELEKELRQYKKELSKITEQKKQIELYIIKLKDNAKNYMSKMKERFETVEKNFNDQLSINKENVNNANIITNLNKSLQKLATDLKTAHSEISSLKKEKSNFTSGVESLKKQKTELNEKMGDIVKEKSELNERIEEMEREKSEWNEKFDVVLKEKSELSEKIDEISNEKIELENKINELKKEKSQLNDQVRELKNSKSDINIGKEKSESNKKIKDLENEITNFEKEKSALNEKILSLNKLNKELNEKINRLEKDNEAHMNSNDTNNIFQDNFNRTVEERDNIKSDLRQMVKKYDEKCNELKKLKEKKFRLTPVFVDQINIIGILNPNFTLNNRSRISHKDLMNMSIQSNESFNERNFQSKKEENNKLKDEIERLKNEIASLIRANTMNEMKLRELKDSESVGIFKILKISDRIQLTLIAKTINKSLFPLEQPVKLELAASGGISDLPQNKSNNVLNNNMNNAISSNINEAMFNPQSKGDVRIKNPEGMEKIDIKIVPNENLNLNPTLENELPMNKPMQPPHHVNQLKKNLNPEANSNSNPNNESVQKMNVQFEENKSEVNCQQCMQILEKFNEFKTNTLKPNNFKDLKQFYVSYHMDIEKIHTKIEEVVTKFTNTDNQFANENQEKKIKVSQVREILSQVQKLISLLSSFINKYNKDVYYHTTNLKKLFDFVAKLVYSSSFLNSFSSMMSSKSPFFKGGSTGMGRIPIEGFLKMLFELNGKVFSPSDLKKIYIVYENRSIIEIIEIFKLNCQVIKNNMVDKLDYDTEFSEIDDSFIKYNSRRNSDIMMNNSYKIVNEKILKLKKFEFDFANLAEVIKNYLVVQELVLRSIYNDNTNKSNFVNSSNQNEMILSDAFKNTEIQKSKIEIIDKLLYITEETLFYKSGDLEDDLIFVRKVVLRLLKNQKFYLNIALE